MRKNYTHIPDMPANRNEFIDCLKKPSCVIVIKHSLIDDLYADINKNLGKNTGKSILKTAGVAALLVCNLYNPLTWIFGIGSIAAGYVLKNEIKKYKIYMGEDVNGCEIIVLVHKNGVNLKYDNICYDSSYVKSVEEKEYRHRVSPTRTEAENA